MNKNTVILISGKIGSGKDSVAKIIEEELHSSDVIVHHEKFADYLKEICSTEFQPMLDELNPIFEKAGLKELVTNPKNFYDDKTILSRHLLQIVGSGLFRKYADSDFWIKHLAHEISQKLFKNESKDNVIVVSDWRFRNELELISYISQYRFTYPDVDVKLVRVIRPNKKSDAIANHPSEIDLDNFQGFDYRINNFGSLATLRSKVKVMLSEFGLL